MDEDGYFWYQARTDDMIISSGYNIAGPEVEEALLDASRRSRSAASSASPDEERGQIVKAFVVLAPGERPTPRRRTELQDHVKARDRAVQVPAPDRVLRRAAEDRDRQAPALRAAPDGAGRVESDGGMKRQDRIKGLDLPAGAWRITVPVRFSHCDPASIVYFPRYFDMINGVVEDWFAGALGLAHPPSSATGASVSGRPMPRPTS